MGELSTEDTDKMQDIVHVDKTQKATVGSKCKKICIILHQEMKNDDFDGIFARTGRSCR